MRINLALLALTLSFCSSLLGQTRTDKCEVYVVDVQLARKAFEEYLTNRTSDSGAIANATRILGTFESEIGEERLTTKHFTFPDNKLVISASVFYTDESFGVRKPSEKLIYDGSILLGLVVSSKTETDAVHATDSAVAEAIYTSNTLGIRVKRLLAIEGREYLVGLQCTCNGAAPPNPKENYLSR